MPDVFASAENFDSLFDLTKEGAGDDKAKENMVKQLHRVLRPFMIRRLKADVAKTLPPKTESILTVGMTKKQKEVYRAILLRNMEAITATKGGEKARLANILMHLRKVCNHPYLMEGVEDRTLDPMGEHLIDNCGKLKLLDKLLPKLKEKGSRVLLFSQFSTMLDIAEDFCNMRGFDYCRIDGQTAYEDRERSIEEYNADNSEKFIFLLSTRAGGLGINLYTADVVVLYDSDWNPQMDLQAMDRAHRIGQKKPVKVYRLVTAGSVEEKVVERAYMKLKLDAVVVQTGRLADKAKGLSKEDMMDMVQFGATNVLSTVKSSSSSSSGGDGGGDADNADITDSDVDKILDAGQKKTKELQDAVNDKLGLKGTGAGGSGGGFLDFKIDSSSFQVFDGVDYKDKAARDAQAERERTSKEIRLQMVQQASSALGERGAKQKVGLNYNETQIFAALALLDKQSVAGPSSGGNAAAKAQRTAAAKLRNLLPVDHRPPHLHPWMLCDRKRIQEITAMEIAHIQVQKGEREPALLKPLPDDADEETKAAAKAEALETSKKPFPQELVEERRRLLLPWGTPAGAGAGAGVGEGFPHWKKRDHDAFLTACTLYGRHNPQAIAEELLSRGHVKSVEEALAYHEAFWTKGPSEDYFGRQAFSKIAAKIEKGEKEIKDSITQHAVQVGLIASYQQAAVLPSASASSSSSAMDMDGEGEGEGENSSSPLSVAKLAAASMTGNIIVPGNPMLLAAAAAGGSPSTSTSSNPSASAPFVGFVVPKTAVNPGPVTAIRAGGDIFSGGALSRDCIEHHREYKKKLPKADGKTGPAAILRSSFPPAPPPLANRQRLVGPALFDGVATLAGNSAPSYSAEEDSYLLAATAANAIRPVLVSAPAPASSLADALAAMPGSSFASLMMSALSGDAEVDPALKKAASMLLDDADFDPTSPEAVAKFRKALVSLSSSSSSSSSSSAAAAPAAGLSASAQKLVQAHSSSVLPLLSEDSAPKLAALRQRVVDEGGFNTATLLDPDHLRRRIASEPLFHHDYLVKSRTYEEHKERAKGMLKVADRALADQIRREEKVRFDASKAEIDLKAAAVKELNAAIGALVKEENEIANAGKKKDKALEAMFAAPAAPSSSSSSSSSSGAAASGKSAKPAGSSSAGAKKASAPSSSSSASKTATGVGQKRKKPDGDEKSAAGGAKAGAAAAAAGAAAGGKPAKKAKTESGAADKDKKAAKGEGEGEEGEKTTKTVEVIEWLGKDDTPNKSLPFACLPPFARAVRDAAKNAGVGKLLSEFIDAYIAANNLPPKSSAIPAKRQLEGALYGLAVKEGGSWKLKDEYNALAEVNANNGNKVAGTTAEEDAIRALLKINPLALKLKKQVKIAGAGAGAGAAGAGEAEDK